MSTTDTSAGGHRCRPWNKGKLVGQKPPLKLREIWAIRIRRLAGRRAARPDAVQPGHRLPGYAAAIG